MDVSDCFPERNNLPIFSFFSLNAFSFIHILLLLLLSNPFFFNVLAFSQIPFHFCSSYYFQHRFTYF
ncbi:hypothetical protein VNO77_06190 [Canavalia gladiata]|uniref:Uncharacterized protein n=1 Tax=Canavalia gladiata TaxID=3824 RepID=A0AAN9QVZ5_CANGL